MCQCSLQFIEIAAKNSISTHVWNFGEWKAIFFGLENFTIQHSHENGIKCIQDSISPSHNIHTNFCLLSYLSSWKIGWYTSFQPPVVLVDGIHWEKEAFADNIKQIIVSYMVLWFVCWRSWCKQKSMDSNFTMNSIIFRYFNLGCHPAPFPSYRKQITEIVRNTLCRVKAESDESDRITCICYETVLCYTMSINIIHYWSKSF